MVPLAATSSGTALSGVLMGRLAVTSRVRLSPLIQVAMAVPLRRVLRPRRWNGGWLTMSRMASSGTLSNPAVTFPLTGISICVDGGVALGALDLARRLDEIAGCKTVAMGMR